jgi:hypothetical protein
MYYLQLRHLRRGLNQREQTDSYQADSYWVAEQEGIADQIGSGAYET